MDINPWTLPDLDQLPSEEDDNHEYKSGAMADGALKKAIGKAASGFWNTGGGLFVAGVDDQGRPDGGVSASVGRQSRRDWVDQVLQDVQPLGEYIVRVIEVGNEGDEDRVALVLWFEASHIAPHMAPDHRYYIRAGAHTVPARHAIVEAIRARRGLVNPILRIVFRLKPEDSQVIQLGLVAVTDAPALDVELSLDPLPEMWKDVSTTFPLKIGLVDRDHPFFMDLSTWAMVDERVGPDVTANVSFTDLRGREFELELPIHPGESVSPWRIGTPSSEQLAKGVDELVKAVKSLAKKVQ